MPAARRGEAVIGATTEGLKRNAWGTKAVTVAVVVGPVTDLADTQRNSPAPKLNWIAPQRR